ncbi:glycoside hydrolase domain-containing protein [Streptomyces sp. NPDC047081]|uniref:glycoside hydrolase domain-containing protein n=1 Tax=Streptomyces sp. NPDC047081 TaxID=3154706 RepID=UPI0033F3971F
MADEMVLQAQRFFNTTYSGYAGMPKLTENGQTSWYVMYALTRALQFELLISPQSDNFGPGTLAALTSKCPSINENTTLSGNFTRIIQSALYCKGYDGGGIDGQYNDRVKAGVAKLKANMGVDSIYPGTSLEPKVVKGLMNMDAYTTISGGSDSVRSIQQWMNSRYIGRADYFVIPCDGLYSRDVQKAQMYAIQYELGMADGTANGVFGPATKAGLKSHTLSVGSSGTWVQLFSAALVFNRRAGVSFTSSYTSDLAAAVSSFQSFLALSVNGTADYPTWASLLVSYGDDTRKGTAFDCADEVTAARAQSLYADGYRLGGRYLTNVPGTTLDKKIKPGELATMASAGLSCFPIYQTYGDSSSYFSRPQGTSDAIAATQAALEHGFKKGTRIYFAIDYDNTGEEIVNNLIPHFRGINEGMAQAGGYYQVGIYATRNACSQVSAAGLSTASFVSNMSAGYSGNLGFPMPADWAIDQIKTITVGSGTGAIEIDNDINSGRESGQKTFDTPPASTDLDTAFDMSWSDQFLTDIQTYFESIGIPESGPPDSWPSPGMTKYTTSFCVEFMLNWDDLFTSLARRLRMRKALIQVSAIWELRHHNITNIADLAVPKVNDDFSDACVYDYYNDGVLPDWVTEFGNKLTSLDDCSTGVGQIFGRRAIAARNHAIDLGLLDEAKRDASNESDIWAVWEKLHFNQSYNISTVPYMHILHASENGLARPGLTTSETDTEKLLQYYQGTTAEAAEQARLRMGMYRIIEDKYQSVFRKYM